MEIIDGCQYVGMSHSDSTDGFDAEDEVVGLTLAAHIAVAPAATREVDTRDIAIVNRTLNRQAEGISMERHDLDADKGRPQCCGSLRTTS